MTLRRFRPLLAAPWLALATLTGCAPAGANGEPAAAPTPAASIQPALPAGPGRWFRISGSALAPHFPTPRPAGWTGPRSVMDAWNGAAASADTLYVFGGGHRDYAGNEVYAFDARRLAWSRLAEPSRDTPENVCVYPDGRPSPPHTYNGLQFAAGRLILVAGPGYGEVFPCKTTWAFDPAAASWRRLADWPGGAGSGTAHFTALDSAGGRLYLHGGDSGRFAEYDIAADRWRGPYGESLWPPHYLTADFDPVRGIVVAVGKGYAYRWKPKHGHRRQLTTKGERACEEASAVGFAYHAGRFWCWSGGRSLYLLNPDGWTWTRVDAAGDDPGRPNQNGTYGRFRYLAGVDAFILVNRTGDNVFLYRPSGEAPVGMDAVRVAGAR